MRPLVGLAGFVALCVGGCSLLFNGKDLRGLNSGGDMAAGGSGGDGGDGNDDLGLDDMMGGGGTGGTGGGGGSTPMCSSRSTVKFTVTQLTTGGTSPLYITGSDINKDGKLDLVTSNDDTNNFSVMLGDGAGGFTLAPTSTSTCANPVDIIARDVTGDGLDDVIVNCFTGSAAALNVYVNKSTATTVAFAPPIAVSLPSTAVYFFPVVGKFDASGHVGLALVGNNKTYFFTGDGIGHFTSASSVAVGASGESPSAAVGNLNGDALDDLIVYNYDDSDMTMLSSHVGSAYTATRLAFDTTDMSPGGQVYFGSTPKLIDFNGDGKLDIVIAAGTSVPGQIYMFKNSGTQTAPAFPVVGTMIYVGDIPVAVAMADFNCDGKLDIIASSNGCEQDTQSCTNDVDQPPEFWELPGNGTGFNPRSTATIIPYCNNFVVADFNSDGYLDVACGGSGSTFNLLINGP